MIRAHRLSAQALDDPSLIVGWNITPNVPYVAKLSPGPAGVTVLLYDETETALIASGVGPLGTAMPCVLLPVIGSFGMFDDDLGWHLQITSTGTEVGRTIRIVPAVDLPDEIHPVYGDDDLAMARATAAIDAAAQYVDEVAVTCPLGLGAGLGDVVSVPVDGIAVVGQVESITWTATPDGTTEQAVIKCSVPIAPAAFIEPPPPVLPVVADDAGTCQADATASGNVLTNDDSGLVVTAVGGVSAGVGTPTAGTGGGLFTIAANGAWTFNPNNEFNALAGEDTRVTSVLYHASVIGGGPEVMAILTVTVTAPSEPVPIDDRWADVVFCINAADGEIDSQVLTDAKAGVTVSVYGDTHIGLVDTDKKAILFDGSGDYATIPNTSANKIEAGLFTFDAWVYRTAQNASGMIGNRGATTSSGGAVTFNNLGQVGLIMYAGWSYHAPYVVPTGLHHIEISVDSSRLVRVFVDGILRGSGTCAAGTSSPEPLQIGRVRASTASAVWFNNGGMLCLRLTRGATVRHTADFDTDLPPYPFPITDV